MRREYPTDIGPVDLLCRDADGAAVAVEIKRRGEIDGVEQLARYLERLNRDPRLRPVRGMFVAQVIKPQARVLADPRGIALRRGRLRRAARHRGGPRQTLLMFRRGGTLIALATAFALLAAACGDPSVDVGAAVRPASSGPTPAVADANGSDKDANGSDKEASSTSNVSSRGETAKAQTAVTALPGTTAATSASTESSTPDTAASSPGSTRPEPRPDPSSDGATTGTNPSPSADTCLAALPVRFRAGQVVWPGIQGDRLLADAGWFAEIGIGGAMVMSPPPDYDRNALATLKGAGRVPLLIATDEEGGRVQRLAGLGALPSALTVASSWTPAQTRATFADHGVKLKNFGIDIVFGPVLDVAPPGGGGPIGDRLYGSDPATVTSYGAAVADGWRDAGLLPTLKHFPGHGAATADTHLSAAVTAPLDQLRTRDLVPYANLAGPPTALMMGHLDVAGLTTAGDTPTSLSAAAYTLARNQYGYQDALIFTDALDMGAITSRYDLPEAAVRSLLAGADIALHNKPYRSGEMIDAVVQATESGRLPTARLDDAVGRILALKAMDPCSLIPR